MKTYKLIEIAGWTSGTSEVAIPPLQRGLVWKPNQVEMLWDSILRGFPIGSFMLSDADDGKFFLLDGQQRFNAISLGYIHLHGDTSVLWLDVEPALSASSTRKYLIKATTKAHPWGYNNDDSSSRLNTSEKRHAIESFGLNGTIYSSSFRLSETWPIKANKPIPLYCLATANRDSEDSFLHSVIETFANSDFANRHNVLNSLTDENMKYIKGLYPAFKKLDGYEIVCNHLSKDVLENESELTTDTEGNATALEILFTRLNTGGTVISRDDLIYSSIKSYWPEIKDTIDQESKSYMEPSKLVNLVFRLMLSEEGKNLGSQPTLKKIRTIAKSEPLIANKIISFCNSQLHRILSQIDSWLNVGNDRDSTPSVLRTSIINKNEDIYLFLMYIAYEHINYKVCIDSSYIKGLALALHFFAYNPRNIVNAMYARLSVEGFDKTIFERSISESLYNEWLRPIYSPEDLRTHIKIGDSPYWIPAGNHPITDFFRYIKHNREMLLYSQKEYLNTHFPNYDPARKDLWEDYNRPWDFDHIVPQNWIKGKWSEYRDYCKYWLNSIGNLAAISFDVNRSKSDRDDYDEYLQNEDSLNFNRDVLTLNPSITYEKVQSTRFAEITLNRLCSIYERLYTDIECIYNNCGAFDVKIENRKRFVESFITKNTDYDAWYYSGGEYYKVSSITNWQYHWIAIGKIMCNLFLTVELNADSECWIGLRKLPTEDINVDMKNSVRLSKKDLPDFDFSDDNNYYCYKRIDFISFDELYFENDLKRLTVLANKAIELTGKS